MSTTKGLHAEIETDWKRELGSRQYGLLRGALHDLAQRHPDSSSLLAAQD